MTKQIKTSPAWLTHPPRPGSFRSIFKWGAKDQFKHPGKGFLKVIKDELAIDDAELEQTGNWADTLVDDHKKSDMPLETAAAFENIVGKDNVASDTFSRLKYSTGKSMEDILNLRDRQVDDISDLVLHPRNKTEIKAIVDLCHENSIPIHVYGGGSSVTLGLTCPKGGVTLVMNTHMNQLVAFNEMNQTITVQPGMMGPVYEDLLNRAPEKLNAEHEYTGGHFPQSFEYSSVGGWVVTLGSGQASSYYGDACDLVISQEYVTPAGTIETKPYPATATGPKVNDIMKGSEGCFGVLVEVTMKVFPKYSDSDRSFAFMFPTFINGVESVRQVSQAGFGMPAILRLSDPEETDVAMKMYGLNNTILDRFIRLRGPKPGKRCILMGQAMGHPAQSRLIFKQVKKICRSNKGMYLTGYPMKKWAHGRFSDPYMRDSLNDVGILIDTLEASVTWEHLLDLHQGVSAHVKSYPNTICMTHASHFYAQGTNLYFIFISRMQSVDEFREFQRRIVEKIIEHHGSLSHHHGVGKMMGSMMEDHLGKEQMGVIRALKRHFDPNDIFNPGGLGL